MWRLSTTRNGTQLFGRESSFYITSFGILRPKSPLLSSENKLVFHFTKQQSKHVHESVIVTSCERPLDR